MAGLGGMERGEGEEINRRYIQIFESILEKRFYERNCEDQKILLGIMEKERTE